MNCASRMILVIAGAVAVGAMGAGLFVESGIYDIGADDHHTKAVLALIEQLRERSIEVRARTIDLRHVEDPPRIVGKMLAPVEEAASPRASSRRRAPHGLKQPSILSK